MMVKLTLCLQGKIQSNGPIISPIAIPKTISIGPLNILYARLPKNTIRHCMSHIIIIGYPLDQHRNIEVSLIFCGSYDKPQHVIVQY